MGEKTWDKILKELEPTVSRPNFATWLKPTELSEDQTGIVTIAVPNPYAKNWIEKNVLTKIYELLRAEIPNIESIRIVVSDQVGRVARHKAAAEAPLFEETEEKIEKETNKEVEPLFNERYNFANFVVGNNTRLAFAAAQVVAEKPGEAYNPLFIYGGVGLGKTHLMLSIGNEIHLRFPKKKIIYTSCETFTSEFIQALQNKTINEFKHKYRTADVFLIDDIQFLSNKEGTQEEFFHTFNMLHQANRQIVMTSDRMPREIADLEDRLTTRFGWGLIADIQAPNFETRLAILQSKAKERNVEVPMDVLEYVANLITNNVRELEGSLIKLETSARVENVPITKDFAKQTLKVMGNQSEGQFSTKQVIKTIAEHFSLETSDLLGSKRTKELVYPRQLVMYVLRENLHQSYPQIGDALGGKDHTTIMHGVNKITKLRKTDEQIESDINAISKKLGKV